MINIENVKKEFQKYVSNYNPENERIKLKIEHISRVAEACNFIATNLNLSKEEIHLAESIGYFHDIGRFEQIKIANTFSDRDSGINHGELSIKVLFENNFIRKFIPDSEYDNIIKAAVLNHNRMHINKENLNEKELLFAKIIRDADKLDIFYTISVPDYSFESIFWYKDFDLAKISDEIIKDFENTHYVNYSKIKNNADVITCFYAYIFDLNFDISLKRVFENKYLDVFTKRVLEKFKSPLIHTQTLKLLENCHNYFKNYLK